MSLPKRSLKFNIPLLYTVALSGGLIFWTGIEKLFLLSIGGDGFAISLNAVVFVAVVLCLDIPTGALADRWGRKHLLLTGLGSLFLSSTVYGLAHSPQIYLIGTILFAIALATINGATQALTYDSLKELDRSQDYNKIHGRLQAALAVGAGTALLLSGFLVEHFGFRFNFRLSMASAATSFLLACLLVEPKQHVYGANKPALKTAIRESFVTIKRNSVLIAAAVLFMVTTAFRWMSDSYSQLIFHDLGLALSLFGVLGFLAASSGAIGRLVSHRFTKYTRPFVAIIIVLFGLVGFGHNKYVILIGLISFYGINQLVQNNCESEIQEHLPSHIRATATSVFTFLSTMLIVPFGLITGIIIKNNDVFGAFKFGGIFGGLALLWWAWYGKNKIRLKSPHSPTGDLIEIEN